MTWKWAEEYTEEWLVPQKRKLKFPDKIIRLVTQSKLTWHYYDYLIQKCGLNEIDLVADTLEYQETRPLLTSFDFAFYFAVTHWASKWHQIYGEGGPNDPGPKFSIANR